MQISKQILSIIATGVIIGFGLMAWKAPVAAENSNAPRGREDLRYDGVPYAQWERLLQRELKPEERIEAIEALGTFAKYGYAREAATAIFEVMRQYDTSTIAAGSPEGKLKSKAIYVFSQIDPEETLPLLKETLSDGSRNGRLFALRVLQKLDSQAPETTIPAIVEAIGHPDSQVATVAIQAATDIDGDLSNEYLKKALRKAVGHGQPQVAEAAIRALVKGEEDIFGRNRSPGVEGEGMDTGGANSFGGAFSDETAYVPELLQAIKSDHQTVAEAARTALIQLGNLGKPLRQAVPALHRMLENDDPDVRWRAVSVLAHLAHYSKAARKAALKFAIEAIKDDENVPYALDILNEVIHSVSPEIVADERVRSVLKDLRDRSDGQTRQRVGEILTWLDRIKHRRLENKSSQRR